jgi:hypothetical protein
MGRPTAEHNTNGQQGMASLACRADGPGASPQVVTVAVMGKWSEEWGYFCQIGVPSGMR